MGGDIYIQIYTGVSTRPSTSRPLLAAYAVQAERLRGLRRAHVPVQPHVHAYIDYDSKEEIANLDNYLKIISCASYLPAISHVCIRSTGKPEPTIPPLPHSNLSSIKTKRAYPLAAKTHYCCFGR